jgi:flagellar biosynthesis component FlhA
MKVKPFKFKKKQAKVEMKPVVKTDIPELEVGQGIIIECATQDKADIQATYRAVKKALAKRKGQKYRVIWLIKSFLIYRVSNEVHK